MIVRVIVKVIFLIPLYISSPFLINSNHFLIIYAKMFKIARYVLLSITLIVGVLFLVSIFKIDEIGSIFLELVILVVFPLLIIAWLITSCPGMDIQ